MADTKERLKVCETPGSRGHIYAFRKYRVCPSGMLQPTGKREDITDQINEIIRSRIWRFAGQSKEFHDLLIKGLLIDSEASRG